MRLSAKDNLLKKNFLCGVVVPVGLPLLILCLLSHPARAAEWRIVAKTAVLMEMRTGKLLWAKNEDLLRPPASTVKILTALITLDRVRMDEILTVPTTTTGNRNSGVPLWPGERLSVKDLLYALLLQSSNDGALALATHIGGSTFKFVELMNQRARSLGALHSHFLNPTGLPQRGQVTTARDLAIIANAALANPEFRRIVATESYPWKSSKWEGVLENSNKLLKSYDGAIGVKTGSTSEAGHCLVAAAQRGNETLIAVLLGGQEKHVWQDAKNLLDYGFKSFAPLASSTKSPTAP